MIGLSSKEARVRLESDGANSLPKKARRLGATIFLSQFLDPLIYLLFAAAIITFFVGERSDPFVVLGVVLLNACIGTYHEVCAERSAQELETLSEGKARVYRDGKSLEILASELVQGDVIELVRGDAIPADCVTLESAEALIDRSMLTGESEPEQVTMGSALYAGCFLVRGRVQAKVVATGERLRLWKLFELATDAKPPQTEIELKMHQLTRWMASASVALFSLVVGIGYLQGRPMANVLLAAVAQIVSMIPEGLPIAITVALAVGAKKLAKHRTLVRHLAAIETLGQTTVICSDKTGTLTQNRMRVVMMDPQSDELIEMAALCSDGTGATEQAIIDAYGRDLEALHKRYPRHGEKPFSSEEKWMATHHKGFSLAKGAPERIAKMCGLHENLGEALMAKGYRVIAVAKAPDDSLEASQLLGLIAIADPLRQGAVEAVATCHRAGIKPMMITGDHYETAKYIGKELGIAPENIHARTQPEEKYEIVKALQAKGEVVAMTGDGSNDAPALSLANVGVAMGKSGTDLAKSSADIIITDDNFTTLVKAVELGRLIDRNIRKLIYYLLSTSMPAVLLMLISIFLDLPLPLVAAQILWINVATEGSVTINLVMDPLSGDEMDGAPRRCGLFDKAALLRMGYHITLLTALLFATFYHGLQKGTELLTVRTETFTLLAICAWLNALNYRHDKRSALHLGGNPYLIVGVLLGVTLHLAVLYIPWLQSIFQTEPLSVSTWGRLLLYGIAFVFMEELRKTVSKYIV